MSRLTASWTAILARRADLRHAVRVTVATGVAFALYHLFSLPQGYWAVFTVVIVMQGSIGGTLGASTDRLIGTLAGAVIGGTLAALRPQTPEGLGAALCLAVGVTAFAAAIRTELKVAPVTAAIMLLSPTGGSGPLEAALFRVLEIGFGSVLAVGATLLIFPARSHTLVGDRLRGVLEAMADLMDRLVLLAEPEAGVTPPDLVRPHDRIRAALAGLEAAMTDAALERRAHLGVHLVPDSVPRTLWRVRTDAATVGRALLRPLPRALSLRLHGAAAHFLATEAAWLRACARSAQTGTPVDRTGSAAAFDTFHGEMEALRRERLTADLTFDEAGRAFAIGYALESLHRNLADLSDRLDEVARGEVRSGAEI